MKIPAGPAIVVCRHLSLADGPILAAALPRGCLFAVSPRFASREPWRFLLQSYGWMTGQRMIPLSPEQPMGIKSLFKQLNRGGKVVIYPEGDVSRNGELLPIQPGTAALWVRSGVPLIPIRYTLKPLRIEPGRAIPAPDSINAGIAIIEHELNQCPQARCLSKKGRFSLGDIVPGKTKAPKVSPGGFRNSPPGRW